MPEATHRMHKYASLDQLGDDIRRPGRIGDASVHVRRELAERVVGLLQGGSNVLLRGPSGVGKTMLVHSLIQAEWRRKPARELGQLQLVDTRPATAAPMIIATDAARFVENCCYVADLENKMAHVLTLARAKPAILFIDPLDTCIGMGASSADPLSDVANLLVPHLDKGLRVISAVTPEGEARLRVGAPRLLQRFVAVDVPAPDDAESRAIARLQLEALERRGTEVAADAVDVGFRLAPRYFPATPVVAAFAKISSRAATEGLVDSNSMHRAVAGELGVRPEYVGCGQPLSFDSVREGLARWVYGQPQALSEVADALVRYATGLVPTGRPVASFLCLGPTGTGKTSLALATAEMLTGSREALVRVDMSEFANPFSIDRLTDDGPSSLIGQLAARPAGVLLLDEIEKAHPAIRQLFLQALGEARLTSDSGRTVRLDNYVVMLTSNVGARRWAMGLPTQKTVPLVLADLAEEFSPEMRARFTRTLVFEPLSKDAAAEIVRRELEGLNEMPGTSERELQLMWPEDLPRALADIGTSVQRGARGIESCVRSLVASPLARWLAEHPEARRGVVMMAPRLQCGRLESLTIDWVDESGFFLELPN